MKKTFVNLIRFLFGVMVLSLFLNINTNTKREVSSMAYSSASSAKFWGMSGNYGVDSNRAHGYMKKACGSKNLVIAVIDTGVDFSHPDLRQSFWLNAKEIPHNGIDDDRNGFVDDSFGWDFATNSPKIIDNNGHGTHISGIISAEGKTNFKYRGVCPGAKIMSLRYYNKNANGTVNLNNSVKAIDYAINMKIRNNIKNMIINYSGGGGQFSKSEFKALKRAEAAGILLVAASGNEAWNTDSKPYYPASYNLSNVVSVTGVNKTGTKIPSSNWGGKSVDLAAPGKAIYSTLPNNKYGFLTGTSQSTAFVSGIAALVWSQNSSLSAQKVKYIIEKSSQYNPNFAGKSLYSSHASALKAVLLLKNGRINTNPRAIAKSKNKTFIKPTTYFKSTKSFFYNY